MRSDDDFDSIMAFDPLLESEKITGKRLGEDRTEEDGLGETSALGFFLLQQHAEAKQRALAERADTYYRMDHKLYLGVLKDLGFELVLEEPFFDIHRDWSKWQNYYYILAHREYGVICTVDTWNSECIGGGITINGGEYYFNWKRKEGGPHYPEGVGYSGGFECHEEDRTKWDDLPDEAWTCVGHVDAREGMRRSFTRLTSSGILLPKWEWNCFHSDPFSTYGDEPQHPPEDKEQAKKITREACNAASKRREAQLPEWVREIYKGSLSRWR